MHIECERKYCAVDFPQVRELLRRAGARCEGAHFESNSVWDTTDGALRRKDCLLRLRTQIWPDRECHVLTLKLQAADNAGCKLREERELSVGDAVVMASVLQGLGYVCAFRYEKVREVWRFPDVEVVLDTLPFAHVMELEGTVEAIDCRAAELALDPAAATTATYHALHTAWRAAQGLPPLLDFVFDDARRGALLDELRKERRS